MVNDVSLGDKKGNHMKTIMNKIFLVLLLCSVSVSSWAVGAKFNAELSGMTLTVNKIDLRKKIIYAGFYEFTYNANTRFIAQSGDVKVTALRKNDQIRFSLNQKKLVSLRPILAEVKIRARK